MSKTKREVVTYTCDICGAELKKSDELAIIGKHVPVLNKTGSKQRWGTLKVDLCADCAKRLLRIRVETSYIPTIKDNMDEWLGDEL